MSLFQTSVVKKYLNDLSPELIDRKYTEFQAYFRDTEQQERIRNLKEEQFQEGFLRELFVKILDYTINPDSNFNLTTEIKNVDDSKKADGAILKENTVTAVIELKSTQTTDLDTVETQAFNYKNHHPKCQYVITSNFEKLRFYIQNAVQHSEFDLFNLSREDFALLWLCLHKDNVLSDIPLKMKEASILQEENITKKLYNDYSKFREEIFNNIVKNNPEYDKLVLFKKTQKLLDRFLFIFFAEDRLLVPPNSINQIVEKWRDDVDFGDVKPLYSIFKQYFHVLNVGRPKSGKRQEIFAYNGGLFLADEILDNIKIDDDILHKHTLKLSTYDFETEVDVNILGHIFEHSLGEIENVQAEIKGEEVDKQKTKRKKDGIFYTPKYITKYIVENTVGKLCEEKRKELEIVDEEYAKGRKNRKKDLVRKLDDKLNEYRNWLLDITILDPACGSGAFLNQALEFLIQEHRKIDELRFQLLGGSIVFSDIEDKILEKNIYGVDLNEESIEIAKLSLWLRTARKGRKLTTLSNHIKCGNSLIDDPEVAGEKAFNWQKEFPEVFKNGGFDIVIGNPPYVHLERIKETSVALKKAKYKTYHSQGDLYTVFVEKGISVLKDKGLISYIMPNKWLQAGYGKPLREFFLKYRLIELIDFGDIQIFQGATTYPCIFISQKTTPHKQISISVLKESNELDFKFNVLETAELFETKSFNSDTWIISSSTHQKILERLKNKFNTLSEYINGESFRGVLTGLTEAFLIDEPLKNDIVRVNPESHDRIKPFLQGRDITRYGSIIPNNYLILFEKGFTNKNISPNKEAEEWLETSYPSISNWLKPFAEKGKKRTDKGDYWWELRACDYYDKFSDPKIMYQVFQVKPCFIYDDKGLFCNNSIWFIPTKNKALLGILNSKLGWWLITKYCTQIQNGYQLIWKYFGQIPIPELSESKLESLVEKMIIFNTKLNDFSNKFKKYIHSQFQTDKLSKKLQNWYTLDFSEFIKELNKELKKSNMEKLSKSDELEWMDIFETKKSELQKLSSEISKTDKKIDQMVYELYGLTEEEIKIVEDNT